MRGIALYGMLLASLIGGPAFAQLQPFGVISGTVVHVTDGDTLRLNNGLVVRLLDINTPELAHDGAAAQPLATQATAALTKLALHKQVQVQLGKRVYDPYNRVLGHVFLNKKTPDRWLNGGMVQSGLAHVYTFPDNRVYGAELLKLEAEARTAKRGIWGLKGWQVQRAETCCADDVIGRFVLVEGKVQRVGYANERTYLNFGDDWRTDFSVVIDRRDEKFFRPQKEISEKKTKKKKGEKVMPKSPFSFNTLLGKTVRVRGMAQPVNGVLVRITHPEQLEILK